MLISKFTNENIKNQVSDMEKKYDIVFPSQYIIFLYKYKLIKIPIRSILRS